jgi:hypothetical protein
MNILEFFQCTVDCSSVKNRKVQDFDKYQQGLKHWNKSIKFSLSYMVLDKISLIQLATMLISEI